MNAPGKDPITKLYDALRASERMRGVSVLFGPRAEPPEGAAPLVCIVPESGALVIPDHSGNVADFAESLRIDCWALTFPTLHEVIRRVLCAVDDYVGSVGDYPADETADGVADCIRWAGDGGIEYDTEPDTNRQGFAAAVNLTVMLSFEKTALSDDAGMGHVDDVWIRPA